MSFEKKKEPVKCSTYHGLNKEYPCICEAQSADSLRSFAEANDIDLMHLVSTEWEKLYKTYPMDGGCWLIQNPALITLQGMAGRKTIIRKPPMFFKSEAALKEQLKKTDEPKQAEREAFPDPDDYQFQMMGEL